MFVLFNNGCCNCPPSDMSTMLMVNILFCLLDSTPYSFSIPVVGGMDCLNQFRWYHSSLGICKFESFHINISGCCCESINWIFVTMNCFKSRLFFSTILFMVVSCRHHKDGRSVCVFSDPIDPMTLLFCIPLEICLYSLGNLSVHQTDYSSARLSLESFFDRSFFSMYSHRNCEFKSNNLKLL